MDNEEIRIFIGRVVECEDKKKYEWEFGRVKRHIADKTFEIECWKNRYGAISAWSDISNFQVVNQ